MTKYNDATTAKPCPFCGGCDLLIDHRLSSIRVVCGGCGIQGPSATSGDPHRLYNDGREYHAAWTAWNNRKRQRRA